MGTLSLAVKGDFPGEVEGVAQLTESSLSLLDGFHPLRVAKVEW